MISAIITITLTIVSLANTAPALPEQSAPAADKSPKYFYYYLQPEVAQQQDDSYVAAQSAPATTYQVPPSYYYQQSRAAPDYQQAGSADPPAVYAQPPSSKSIQRRPSHRTQHPTIIAAVQYPGQKPKYYKPYFWA